MANPPLHQTFECRPLPRPDEELLDQGWVRPDPADRMLRCGYKRLPDASRSLGRSLRIFTSEVSAHRSGP